MINLVTFSVPLQMLLEDNLLHLRKDKMSILLQSDEGTWSDLEYGIFT